MTGKGRLVISQGKLVPNIPAQILSTLRMKWFLSPVARQEFISDVLAKHFIC